MSNNPINGPESAKTVSVDDQHINAPRVLSSWKSLRDRKTVSNSPRNGLESAKTVSVDDRHVKAPWDSTTMEIALGPLNGE